jgi:hypothetical protein
MPVLATKSWLVLGAIRIFLISPRRVTVRRNHTPARPATSGPAATRGGRVPSARNRILYATNHSRHRRHVVEPFAATGLVTLATAPRWKRRCADRCRDGARSTPTGEHCRMWSVSKPRRFGTPPGPEECREGRTPRPSSCAPQQITFAALAFLRRRERRRRRALAAASASSRR